MTKFRSDHDIPNDVLIERPCPNKVATILGVEDCIPGSVNFVLTMLSVDTLMRREGLQFNAYDLLHVDLEEMQRVQVQALVIPLARLTFWGQRGTIDSELPPIPPALGDEVDNSFVGGEGVDSNSEVDMPLKAKNLGDALAPHKAELAILEPRVCSYQAQEAVMLPQDVDDLTVEDSVEVGDLMVMQYVQVFDCSFNRDGDYYLRQVVELRPGIFHEEEAVEGEDEVGEAGAKDELGAGVEGNGAGDQDIT
ncbi:hypothetical protein Acr_18g0006480 [Actinidia rufa]|uniref:Uncharacterized protein n=1 Tax=Actinidia rufa TaxID=165716 RepID=A0A7J0G6R5_9ERIC|nr:hypothetical protein Acr_18g0006480 [Actinidia rufa]